MDNTWLAHLRSRVTEGPSQPNRERREREREEVYPVKIEDLMAEELQVQLVASVCKKVQV